MTTIRYTPLDGQGNAIGPTREVPLAGPVRLTTKGARDLQPVQCIAQTRTLLRLITFGRQFVALVPFDRPLGPGEIDHGVFVTAQDAIAALRRLTPAHFRRPNKQERRRGKRHVMIVRKTLRLMQFPERNGHIAGMARYRRRVLARQRRRF